ncbi:MAG: hypothetical protein ACRCZ2_11190 [Fusobacteriaceae bacterium]
MDNNFNNMFNQSKTFDSFNGTELKCYMKVTTEYDEFGQTKKFKLVEMGHISAITSVDQFSAQPIPAIGFGRPIGISVGSSIVVGSLTFEALAAGFTQEVQDLLREAGLKRHHLEYDEEGNEMKLGYSEIKEIQDYPLVDIVIIGVKENNQDKKIQKEILGIRFNKAGSGIGLNQLGVREQYNFMAQEMTDFAPVKGVKEDIAGEDDTEVDAIFG